MNEPKLVEVVISQSTGGSVQILDYSKVKSDWHVSENHKWAFPEDWDEDAIEAFVAEKREALRRKVDKLGDREYVERWNQSYLSDEYGKIDPEE